MPSLDLLKKAFGYQSGDYLFECFIALALDWDSQSQEPPLLTRPDLGSPQNMRVIQHLSGDARTLFVARAVRMFSFGSTGVILAVFLHQIRLSDDRLGLLLTFTLLGDVVISLVTTLLADRAGRRRMLLIGCALLVLAGAVFARATTAAGGAFWVLVAAATVGVLSPSGNEVGPFMALEQAVLAEIVPAELRTDAFAWYNLVGYLSTAVGAAEGGALVDWLSQKAGLPLADAFRAVFVQYAALGAVLAVTTMLLSSRIEGQHHPAAQHSYSPLPSSAPDADDTRQRGQQLVLPAHAANTASAACKGGLFGLSPRSLRIVFQLSALFSIDSFAGSLINGTLLSYYFHLTYDASPAYLGALLFGANAIAGVSSLLSGRIAAKIGLVNTMVFTHLPSNVLLIAVPLMPNLAWATAMVVLRFTLSQMDVAPRTSYVAGVVAPSERAATLGIVNTAKTLAAAGGPLVTGHLAAAGRYRWAFFLCGGLKVAYDLVLLWSFSSLKPDAEQAMVPIEEAVEEEKEGAAGPYQRLQGIAQMCCS